MIEARRAHDVVRARRPGEVVHVFLIVPMRRRSPIRPVSTLAPLALDSGGTERPSLRHGQRDVVDAVVGEELRVRVELMTVPSIVLKDTELREPLRDEEIVANDAC